MTTRKILTCDNPVILTCATPPNLSYGGISAIRHHVNSEKHVSLECNKCTTQSLALFIPKEQISSISKKIAAAEGTFAYHTVRHHHSFRTMDCTSRLLSVCFSDSDIAKNFHSAGTKSERIITGVLAPLSIDEVLIALKPNTKFSLSTDASNHAEFKTFPIRIRYFNQGGIHNKLLDFVHPDGERAQQILEMLLEVISNYELNMTNLVAFCADNAPVDFGGVNKAEGEDVFTKLKELNPNLIPLGCPSHLIHKSAQVAGERGLSVDVESIAMKITSFFSGERSGIFQRHQKFAEFVIF